MEIVNLLDFLNSSKDLYTLDYATCGNDFVNFLEIISGDKQFIQKIDLGIFYLNKKTNNQFIIVDGVARILSLSLLLHAICECYKKTTQKNENAIKIIRKKYLLDDNKTKLKLPSNMQTIYDKIIFGEVLSGKEKESSLFQLLHNYWVQIKTQDLQASEIFKMLKKIYVFMVNTENIPNRDLYYTLNNDKRNINQILLIKSYLKNIGINQEWNNIENLYNSNSLKLNLFLKDFFVTKYDFQEYSDKHLYKYFVNYFETMLQYMPEDILISKIEHVAKLYLDIINVNLHSENLNKVLIKIKKHNGEDTFAYILNIYEDFIDENLTESSFLEILLTIDEYLQKRAKTPNNVSFNELINYLNAFITCK